MTEGEGVRVGFKGRLGGLPIYESAQDDKAGQSHGRQECKLAAFACPKADRAAIGAKITLARGTQWRPPPWTPSSRGQPPIALLPGVQSSRLGPRGACAEIGPSRASAWPASAHPCSTTSTASSTNGGALAASGLALRRPISGEIQGRRGQPLACAPESGRVCVCAGLLRDGAQPNAALPLRCRCAVPPSPVVPANVWPIHDTRRLRRDIPVRQAPNRATCHPNADRASLRRLRTAGSPALLAPPPPTAPSQSSHHHFHWHPNTCLPRATRRPSPIVPCAATRT